MRFLALDTETIRLPQGSRPPQMCQLAMVSDDTDVRTAADLVLSRRTLNELLDPEAGADEWEAGAIEVHGITPEAVAGKPTFLAAFPRIWSVAAGAEVLVGYNLAFDIGVLQRALRDAGLETNFPWPRLHVDVMQLAQQKLRLEGKRGQKAPTLGEIYEHVIGRPLEGAHDALADIEATVQVWERLR